jgi:hypothetical protein
VRALLLRTFLLIFLISPATLQGQEAEPLQKSDVIRLLTGTTYSKAEVAGIIRQSCLSFVPTPRDREDFRALGADDTIMTAIDRCEGAPPPAAPSTARQWQLESRILNVTAGETVRIPVTIRGGGAGLRLQLVGSGALVGGSDARAETDGNGEATFVFPVGPVAGEFNLTLASDVQIGGSRAVTIRVSPAAPARAIGEPDPLALGPGDSPVALTVRVTDEYGNGTASVPVEVRAGTATGPVLASGRTSAGGTLSVSLVPSLLEGAQRLVYVSGGEELGASGVAQPAAEATQIAVISGGDQSGAVDQELPSPLVVAVLGQGGRPVSGAEVRFSVTNGAVRPETVRTDDRGRAATRVTMGAGGAETTVTVSAGGAIQSIRFPVTRGGMTVSAIEAALAEGASLLEAGDIAGAREQYERVLRADPSDLRAATGVADTYLAEGDDAEAVVRYRAILRAGPSRRTAQVGMARASLGVGNAAEAARWFELALSQDRTDVESWVGLGEARSRLGDEAGAREAYNRALDLAPADEAALRGLERLNESPLLLEAKVWGGYTDDNGRDPGFRWAELDIRPGAGFDLWFAFDNMLSFRHPYLVRGRDDIEGFYGGLGYGYGADRAYRTSFEIGRRKEPVDGTIQTTWTLDQTFGLGSGGWFKLGGWLGHWYDRDDWVVFGEGSIPAGPGLEVRPAVSYGDYFGSEITGLPPGVPNRSPKKELRVGLGVRFETASGFGIEPRVAYGNVDSDVSEELSGSLWDGSARLWYPVSRAFAVDGFVQYQAPPGVPSFWRFALGVRFGVLRSD